MIINESTLKCFYPIVIVHLQLREDSNCLIGDTLQLRLREVSRHCTETEVYLPVMLQQVQVAEGHK